MAKFVIADTGSSSIFSVRQFNEQYTTYRTITTQNDKNDQTIVDSSVINDNSYDLSPSTQFTLSSTSVPVSSSSSNETATTVSVGDKVVFVTTDNNSLYILK